MQNPAPLDPRPSEVKDRLNAQLAMKQKKQRKAIFRIEPQKDMRVKPQRQKDVNQIAS
jgi:hypothetical protein